MIRRQLTPLEAAIVVAMLAGFAGCSSQPTETGSTAAAPPIGSAPESAERIVAGKAPVGGGLPTVVVLQPRDARKFPAPEGVPVMDQVAMVFVPTILLVRTGQPAEFRNSDPDLHNVRVREEATKEGVFNVAIPTGGAYRHTFARDGFYDVGCDIHPAMSATVIAVSTPFAAMAEADGSFAFDDVPPGSYMLRAYAGARSFEEPVEVISGRVLVDLADSERSQP